MNAPASEQSLPAVPSKPKLCGVHQVLIVLVMFVCFHTLLCHLVMGHRLIKRAQPTLLDFVGRTKACAFDALLDQLLQASKATAHTKFLERPESFEDRANR